MAASSLAPTTGLTITGNGTASVSVSGLLSALKTALPTLVYTPKTGYSGADTFSLTILDTTDQAKGVAALTAIKVNPLPAVKAPTSVSVNENGSLSFSGVNAISVVDTAGAGNNAGALTLAVFHGSLKFGTTTVLTDHGQRNGIRQRQRPAVRVEDGGLLPTLCLHAKDLERLQQREDTFSLTILDATDQAKSVAALTA